MHLRSLIAAAACAAGLCMAQPCRADEGRCLIVVDGRTYLKGRCEIAIHAGGSFTVGVSDKARSEHFAYVSREDIPNRARGAWNGVDADSHAGTDLGVLTRHGACWRNARARVCAWR